MQDDGFLLAIAEIAVTLAGFSGLVVAIRGARPTAWHPRDIWSLSAMFGASLGALFMALLPMVLTFLRVREGMVWTVANLVMCVFLVGFALALAVSGRRLSKLGHRPRVRYFPAVTTSLLVVAGLLSGLAGLGIFSHSRIGFVVLGLMGCLLISALSLVVFLVILARSAVARS